MKVLTAHPGIFNDDKVIESNISFVPFLNYLKEKVAPPSTTSSLINLKVTPTH
jgi:hypothetical protein